MGRFEWFWPALWTLSLFVGLLGPQAAQTEENIARDTLINLARTVLAASELEAVIKNDAVNVAEATNTQAQYTLIERQNEETNAKLLEGHL